MSAINRVQLVHTLTLTHETLHRLKSLDEYVRPFQNRWNGYL